jgi:hypothetical protein
MNLITVVCISRLKLQKLNYSAQNGKYEIHECPTGKRNLPLLNLCLF